MFLSREKRHEFDIFKDYFEMFNPSGFKEFYYSTKYRCYLNADVYPCFKRDIHNWFKDKDYYPESHLENPKKGGVWYVKPNEGANGEGIIITDDVRSVDMKNAVYQKSIDNPLLYNGRKQDIRIFVVLQTYQGYFRSYIYYEAPVRLSPLQYDKNDLSKKVQLTNVELYYEKSISETLSGLYESIELKPKYGKDIMDGRNQMMIQFTEHEYFEEIYNEVEDIAMGFSNDVYNKMNNKTQRNLIHIFGFDFIPDKNKKVWLLEINDNTHPTVIDGIRYGDHYIGNILIADFTKNLSEDLLNELIYPMENDSDVKLDKFEMVYEKKLLFNKWIFV
jgi:hypothetical protein